MIRDDRPVQIRATYEVQDESIVERRRLILPEGLTLEAANNAARMIESWGDSDRSNRDLAVELFIFFNRDRS